MLEWRNWNVGRSLGRIETRVTGMGNTKGRRRRVGGEVGWGSMETSWNAGQHRIIEKVEGGYIVEVNGKLIIFPEEMILTILSGLLARAI
ncbi:hypothetical protein BT69DRAFT_475619 [Atractiella rhizophila]|nr:hypothetical protein BT69DRAFT_475619 [Atractiella rhizophila]